MQRRIILASASPRRRELLRQIGVEAEVMVSDIREGFPPGIPAKDQVQKLALLKAESVARLVVEGLVIGADTVVVCDERVLGKPENRFHAREMIHSLSGREHRVITGVAVVEKPGGRIVTGYEETKVFFRQLTSTEIDAYIDSGEPSDKAGGYGIQGRGALLVERIEGDYFNVVGLPLQKLNDMLSSLRINLLLY